MRTAHTPGPWTFARPNPDCVADAPPAWITDGEHRIADVMMQGKATASNAALIAAAPDLLALAQLVAQLRKAPGKHPAEIGAGMLAHLVDTATAAVRKATGE